MEHLGKCFQKPPEFYRQQKISVLGMKYLTVSNIQNFWANFQIFAENYSDSGTKDSTVRYVSPNPTPPTMRQTE